MEAQEKSKKDWFLRVILLFIAIGVWVNVFQNMGVINKTYSVDVTNEVDANVRGNVNAQVHGSVSVDNVVDINLEKVIGHTVGSHKSYTSDGVEYAAIDVAIAR